MSTPNFWTIIALFFGNKQLKIPPPPLPLNGPAIKRRTFRREVAKKSYPLNGWAIKEKLTVFGTFLVYFGAIFLRLPLILRGAVPKKKRK